MLLKNDEPSSTMAGASPDLKGTLAKEVPTDASSPLPTLAAVNADELLARSTALLDVLDAWYRDGWDTSVLAPFETPLVQPVVLALSLALLTLRWYGSRAGKQLTGAARAIDLLLLVVTLALVAGYLLSLGGSALGATRPAQVGWPAAAGAFVVAAAVALNLTLHLLHTLQGFATDGGFSWRPGLLAWPVGLIALLLAGWLLPWATVLVAVALSVSQLFQIGAAAWKLQTAGHASAALVAVPLYLLGTVSVVMLWLTLLHLLVPVVIIIGLLAMPSRKGIGTASPKIPPRKCQNCHQPLSLSNSTSGRICTYCYSWEEKRRRGEV